MRIERQQSIHNAATHDEEELYRAASKIKPVDSVSVNSRLLAVLESEVYANHKQSTIINLAEKGVYVC